MASLREVNKIENVYLTLTVRLTIRVDLPLAVRSFSVVKEGKNGLKKKRKQLHIYPPAHHGQSECKTYIFSDNFPNFIQKKCW